jgi:multidrug efflux system membrane fusion protein
MKAEFPNADLQLWPGQFVNVRLLVDTLDRVVVVPTPAVQRGPNGTFAYVVGAEDRVGLRPVAVAHQTETRAVIARGIQAGDRVVTTGFSRLKDGAHVAVAAPAEPQTPPAAETAPKAAKGGARAASFRAACAGDIQKFCANVERPGAIGACLKASAPQLSEACRQAARDLSEARVRKTGLREGEGGNSK